VSLAATAAARDSWVMLIRPATLEDHATYTRLFARLGVDDPPVGPERFVRELMPTTWVAHDDEGPLGYLYFQLLGTDCYVRHVVTDAQRERRGVARALLSALRTHALALGKTSWRLNVKPDNTRAVALYSALGMREVSRSRVLRLPGWPQIAPIVDDAARASVTVRDVAREEDAAIENAFALITGQLAAARAVSTRQLVLALDDGQPVGFALFEPSFPGAFPFRARDLVVTDAIVQFLAARTRAESSMAAPEGRAFIQLVVEDDEALSRALLARGATQVMETCHYRGALDDSSAPIASSTQGSTSTFGGPRS
jgi:ribosomal protein S18 acetylase RimI-like enzyme